MGVIGHVYFKTLTEIQIHAFDYDYFGHSRCLLLIRISRIHSIYYINRKQTITFGGCQYKPQLYLIGLQIAVLVAGNKRLCMKFASRGQRRGNNVRNIIKL